MEHSIIRRDTTFCNMTITKTTCRDGYDETRLGQSLHSFNDQPSRVSPNNKIMYWHSHGLLHREDGPAYVNGIVGTFKWYRLGRLHRKDRPAYQSLNEERWYLHGELHRTDGPAVTRRTGTGLYVGWAVNGHSCKFDDWVNTSDCNDELAVLLKLQYAEYI